MRDETAPSGPVVPLLEEAELAEASRSVYRQVRGDRGGMPNVFKALANEPKLLGVVAALGTFYRKDAGLDRLLCEAVIATVAEELGSLYEWTHHAGVVRQLGLDPVEVVRVSQDENRDSTSAPFLNETFLSALLLAHAIASGSPVDHALVESAEAQLGARGLVELTILVGYYTMLARTIDVLAVPLETNVKPEAFPEGTEAKMESRSTRGKHNRGVARP